MLESIKIWQQLGSQFIPDLVAAKPLGFKMGFPILNNAISDDLAYACEIICPTKAYNAFDKSIDMGKCIFCGECVRVAGTDQINFTNDCHTATNIRQNLIVKAGENTSINIDQNKIRKEIKQYFGQSLKLRQISAGGDNSCEWELNACSNPNFDMGRYGIEFVASPRHADGIVITGPITQNMAEAVQICYDAVCDPKIIILAGTDAISGGLFVDSPAINRNFLAKYTIDLYVPGNPIHPLTFINGVLELIRDSKV